MTKWEYKILKSGTDCEFNSEIMSIKDLNDLGQEGWELVDIDFLVSIISQNGHKHNVGQQYKKVYTFKREIK